MGDENKTETLAVEVPLEVADALRDAVRRGEFADMDSLVESILREWLDRG